MGAGTNLIRNPDAENLGVGANLTDALNGAVLTWDNTEHHTGSYSFKAVYDTSGPYEVVSWWSDDPGVNDEQTFYGEAWVKGVGTVYSTVFVYTGGYAAQRSNPQPTVLTGDWQLLESVVSTQSGDLIDEARFAIYNTPNDGATGAAATVYVDDIWVSLTPPPAGANSPVNRFQSGQRARLRLCSLMGVE